LVPAPSAWIVASGSQMSNATSGYPTLGTNDWPLRAVDSLQPGTHLVTARRGYTHHGVYVGEGKVIQYGGFVRGLHSGPVEEVSLEQFANGHPVWFRQGRLPTFEPHQIVERARTRIGENRYHVLTNNCEHFCEWCLRGEHRSDQVDQLLSLPTRALGPLAGVLGRVAHVRAIRAGSANRLSPHAGGSVGVMR
jgi:hypothetical protein